MTPDQGAGYFWPLLGLSCASAVSAVPQSNHCSGFCHRRWVLSIFFFNINSTEVWFAQNTIHWFYVCNCVLTNTYTCVNHRHHHDQTFLLQQNKTTHPHLPCSQTTQQRDRWGKEVGVGVGGPHSVCDTVLWKKWCSYRNAWYSLSWGSSGLCCNKWPNISCYEEYDIDLCH